MQAWLNRCAVGGMVCLMVITAARPATAAPQSESKDSGNSRAAADQSSGAAETPSAAPSPLGRTIADFRLQDYRGREHSLAEYADRPVVVLCVLGTECPLARLYGPRLAELAGEFADRGVQFLGLAPNTQDSITEIAAYARVAGIAFPILKDLGNQVADQIGAKRTPEVFVLDRRRVVRYHGRVDDQYGLGSGSGYAQPEVNQRYLADAVEAVLAGHEVAVASTPLHGCLIGRVRTAQADSRVTYSNQVARVLAKHCVECHRPGQIAPFALTDYDEVVGWADMIEEVVSQQRMPPWHADPAFGHFRNDRSMSDEDKETLYAWVRAGAPEGDPADLPEPLDYPEGWQYRTPDEVFHLADKPYEVQAEGVLDYQYFVVDPGWKEDRWYKSSECLIDNRSVVHHVFVFAVPPGTEIPEFNGPDDARGEFNPGAGGVTLIAGAAPGTPPWINPPGFAGFLAAGTRLVFQMHYTPNGRSQLDRTAVGFTWVDPVEVKHNTVMNMAINFGFKIPPHAGNHPVDATHNFRDDALILNLAPHMHLRGKSFRYDLHYPDGSVETLLNVPRYDFNWQTIYMLAEPKYVPAGTTMKCLARFDNSADNLANPDPEAEVRWGDQTWEEMCIGWFMQSTDVDPELIDPAHSRTARFLAAVESDPPKLTALTRKWAAKALDSDQDFAKLARRVSQLVPQVDRVCASVVEGSQVRFVHVAQPPVFHAVLGRAGRTLDASESALARFAASPEPVVEPDLAQADGADLKCMTARVGSSLHVPITIDGRAATINFWSKERQAFPQPAVELLADLVRLMNRQATATAQLND